MATTKDICDGVGAELEFDPVDVTWFVQDALDRNALTDDDLYVTG